MIFLLFWIALTPSYAQINSGSRSSDILIKIGTPRPHRLAVAEFRGDGVAEPVLQELNRVLWTELEASGALTLAARTACPTMNPNTLDLLTAAVASTWRKTPCNANYLALGYAGVQDNRLVLVGWLANLADGATHQIFGRVYKGGLTVDGAKDVARQFAKDILQSFGAQPLFEHGIFFVSNRTGYKEIWRMNYDGSAQTQVTFAKSITIQPGVSPDGRWLAYTTLVGLRYEIRLQPITGGRVRSISHPDSHLNHTPSFSADGKRLYFSAAVGGWSNLFAYDLAAGRIQRLTQVRAVEVEPRVNPRADDPIVFTSGRGGRPQIYSMNSEGLDIQPVTSGEGEAVNPSWHPNGEHLAFAWTGGKEVGSFNIFVMDFRSKLYVQLTSGGQVHENPTWAATGRHLAYAVRHQGNSQIWVMLADGTGRKQLTEKGGNFQPVWARFPE